MDDSYYKKMLGGCISQFPSNMIIETGGFGWLNELGSWIT
jgi:hypothetical protein